VTIRIVKGANMEMERVEASIKGWPQAPYRSKLETDANYKRMLRYGMYPERLEAVQLGVASHNLFDLAYAMVLAVATHSIDRVQFEMLEGMANHQRRAVLELSQRLLLYAPACYREEFINAIGYLIRRLDENTGPDNFLRHAFKISVGSSTWQRLENGFIESIRRIDQVPFDARRTQDRNTPPRQPPALLAARKIATLHQDSPLRQPTGGVSRMNPIRIFHSCSTPVGPKKSSRTGCPNAMQMPLGYPSPSAGNRSKAAAVWSNRSILPDQALSRLDTAKLTRCN
jgi:hypothetical protein